MKIKLSNLPDNVKPHHIGEALQSGCTCDLCKAMIPGDHPIKPIANLEEQFYNLLNVDKVYLEIVKKLGLDNPKDGKVIYKPDGTPFTLDELYQIDEFIRKEIALPNKTIELNVVRAHILGNILSSKKVKRIIWNDLPDTLKDAVKEYNLTQHEINAVRHAMNHAALGIVDIEQTAAKDVINTVIQSQLKKLGNHALKTELKSVITDTDSNLNRDWRRVAITTSNNAVNHGFLMGLEPGTVVIGQSHPDACNWCLANINGKEFRVRAEPAPDYSELDPGSDEYRQLSEIWDREVWVGKSNIGRAASPRKRTDDGLVPREHHELWTPTLHVHPNCRCFWLEKTEFD